MIVPKHPGSRLVDQRPDLLRVIRRIEAEVTRIAHAARPEMMAFVPAPVSRGEPATSATMADVLVYKVYRTGGHLYADLSCGTGTGSVVEAQFWVPDLGVTGPAVATPSGGTAREMRITLAMPPEWASGAAHNVFIQARRVSGSDATTVRALRAWQR